MSALTRTNVNDQPGDPAVRVLALGATGFEQALRLDDRIELLRCADAFDAVGELSDPIDVLSPTRAVVLISRHAGLNERDQRELCAALRRVDDNVRIIALARAGEAPADIFDAVLDPETPEDRVVALVTDGTPVPRLEPLQPEPAGEPEVVIDPEPQQEAESAAAAAAEPATESEPPVAVNPDPDPEPEPAPAPTPKPVLESEPIPAPRDIPPDELDLDRAAMLDPVLPAEAELTPAPPATSSAAHTDDLPILRALLDQADVLPPALALIGARTGFTGVRFVPEGEPVPPGVAAEVRGPAGRFGVLCLPGENTADARTQIAPLLEHHAAWLADWLRLSARDRDLRRAAFTDPLTGAWNRRYFDRFLGAAIGRARDARLPLTVMVFDIDNFKAYNDRHGHGAGDEILVETVKLLGSTIRPTDRVCRIGGDEFAVIFFEPEGPRDPSSKPPESVYQIAKRFQQQVCQHRFPKLGAHAQGTLTISGGLATYPWDGTDTQALLARADELALRSKAQGKNALTFGPGASRVCHIPGAPADPDAPAS